MITNKIGAKIAPIKFYFAAAAALLALASSNIF